MIGRLNHVAIAVADLDKASALYRDTLGAVVSAPHDQPAHGVTVVFVELPKPAIQAMFAKGWLFYNFIGEGGCRLMCSWDTQEEDVRAFAADLAAAMPG